MANLLTILGKGGLPRLEMVGAVPVGALLRDRWGRACLGSAGLQAGSGRLVRV